MKSEHFRYDPFPQKKCPICKNKFIPAPQHAWKIGTEKGGQLVCSYHCMRAYEKAAAAKNKKRKTKYEKLL